jgi:hypothetical protein
VTLKERKGLYYFAQMDGSDCGLVKLRSSPFGPETQETSALFHPEAPSPSRGGWRLNRTLDLLPHSPTRRRRNQPGLAHALPRFFCFLACSMIYRVSSLAVCCCCMSICFFSFSCCCSCRFHLNKGCGRIGNDEKKYLVMHHS